jgi:hypothetical protein
MVAAMEVGREPSPAYVSPRRKAVVWALPRNPALRRPESRAAPGTLSMWEHRASTPSVRVQARPPPAQRGLSPAARNDIGGGGGGGGG